MREWKRHSTPCSNLPKQSVLLPICLQLLRAKRKREQENIDRMVSFRTGSYLRPERVLRNKYINRPTADVSRAKAAGNQSQIRSTSLYPESSTHVFHSRPEYIAVDSFYLVVVHFFLAWPHPKQRQTELQQINRSPGDLSYSTIAMSAAGGVAEATNK